MSVVCNNYDCPICGVTEKEINFYGYGHCNHPICGTCAIKLQKFSQDIENDYDYSKCVICKQDIKKIIISSKIIPFENYNETSLLSDDKFGLIFESKHARDFYNLIIQIFCPQCKLPLGSMEELMKHLGSHKRRYCELCVSYRKCLQYELEVLTDNDYHQHRNKKHPKCRFCEIRFYDDSHLIKHVKEQHFLCDICHRTRGFVSFNTQAELLKHYAKDHHVCEICRLNNNINVFESDYNLRAHKVTSHSLSLVNEGLVNVNYGDRDNLRYGARRRVREATDDIFDDIQSVEAPQLIPTMNCEQEFPPLGTDPAIPNQQLGTQSLNVDENDTRTAFNDGSHSPASNTLISAVTKDPNNNFKKSVTSCNKSDMSMSNNFAISLKKSVGSLNRDDFPALSTTIATGDTNINIGTDKSKYAKSARHTVSSGFNDKSKTPAVTEDDFPSLTTTENRRQAPSNQSWKPVMNTVGNTSVSSVSHRANAKKQVIGTSVVTTDSRHQGVAEDSADYNSIDITAVAHKPKVCLMTQEEFEQSNTSAAKKSELRQYHQTLPNEHDFPSLDSKRKSGIMASTNVGAWGKFQVPNNNNIGLSCSDENKKTITGTEENFAIQSPMDFPELPFKELSVSNVISGKGKHKQTLSNVTKKPVITAPVTSSYNNGLFTKQTVIQEQSKTTKSSNSVKKPASLRNIDYIPSVVAPTRDPITLVDSARFSIIKATCDQLSMSTELSLDSCTDAPVSIASSGQDVTDNRYGLFSGTSDTPNGTTEVKVNKQQNKFGRSKTVAPSAPEMSSESEFPSLGAHPTRNTNDSTSNQKQKLAESRRRDHQSKSSSTKSMATAVSLPQSPVVSLMDVAMSVTRTQYTAFPDADTRNESMFLRVSESMAPELAVRFLQLANLYRTRQLSVREYLTSIESEFANDRDTIATMLPEMCVLLPDIPLQRSLLAEMPKSWIRDLRECSKCDQVIHKADIGAHNQLAH